MGSACVDGGSGVTAGDDPTATSRTGKTVDQGPTVASSAADETDVCRELTVDELLVGRFDPDRDIREIVVGRTDDGDYVLALCGPQPSTVALGANKPPRALVADIEGDWIDEIFVGAATGRSPFAGTTVSVIEGRLVDRRIALEVVPGGFGQDGTSFGCVDVDDDGRRELVNLRYRFSANDIDDSDQVVWWRWVAGTDPEAGSDTGTYDLPAERPSAETLVDGTCGDSVLVDVVG